MAHVFISYSRKQFYFAESLALSLQRRRVPTWFDVQYLVPGANWQQSLQEGLDGNVAYSPYKHLGISPKVRSLSYPTKLVRNPSPKSSDSHRFHGDEPANVFMLELSTSWQFANKLLVGFYPYCASRGVNIWNAVLSARQPS